MHYRLLEDNFKEALDVFIPGIAKHASLIKYENVTPDMSIVCFRTTGSSGDHYFCLIDYDFMHSIKYGAKVVGSYFAKVIEFMSPVEKQKGRTQLEQKSVGVQGSNILLARTERPQGNGYWSSNIVLLPGDEIAPKIMHLSDSDKSEFLNAYLTVVNHHAGNNAEPDPDDFLEGWQKKVSRHFLKVDDVKVNDTNLAISFYKNLSGAWESFFNYVK